MASSPGNHKLADSQSIVTFDIQTGETRETVCVVVTKYKEGEKQFFTPIKIEKIIWGIHASFSVPKIPEESCHAMTWDQLVTLIADLIKAYDAKRLTVPAKNEPYTKPAPKYLPA
ncbi:hypothetical protein COY32_03915 [candidate division WWE3 bacterium CG_4_10_14_0_2_um_filter_41_14]|uniref:Uncharacterized protein n=1 Tax=candidate division WWE3 bacterium CG_4_10_14_0_2_um_filter_41_14 TaxID=1975072 RepID=A0A2M7TI93_UNCKA|nr:MAG: hypothetical protein COY32_03915 [candidate division WWE3 bacterium CG_4_10_14_0_2_um_filter_41_14]